MNRHIQQVPKYVAAMATAATMAYGHPAEFGSSIVWRRTHPPIHITPAPIAPLASRNRFAPMNSPILRMGRTV